MVGGNQHAERVERVRRTSRRRRVLILGESVSMGIFAPIFVEFGVFTKPERQKGGARNRADASPSHLTKARGQAQIQLIRLRSGQGFTDAQSRAMKTAEGFLFRESVELFFYLTAAASAR